MNIAVRFFEVFWLFWFSNEPDVITCELSNVHWHLTKLHLPEISLCWYCGGISQAYTGQYRWMCVTAYDSHDDPRNI